MLIIGARGRLDRIDRGAGKATEIVFAGLASINISGMFGLGWFVAVLLIYDGVMFVELTICTIFMVVLALITAGAFLLRHRGKTNAAVALLAVAALPTIASYGFMIYLDTHPIDMR